MGRLIQKQIVMVFVWGILTVLLLSFATPFRVSAREHSEQVASVQVVSAEGPPPANSEKDVFRLPFWNDLIRFLVRGSLVFGGVVLLGMGIFIMKVPEKKDSPPPIE